MVTIAADGSIIIDTRIDTGGFSKGAANLKNQFGSLGSSMKKLGGLVAAAFSVKAIVAFGKEAIELGSDLQEVQNVVDVTFTTMNEQINEYAKNAAMTAGLSETMAKQYTGTFGAMAKSFGFTEKEAYSMSTALTQLAGDVASFYNLSQDAAYTKLKSVFTGETEALKDLGVVMTQTALDDFALRKGLGKTTSQMSEQEKVALRYQFVLEQLNNASGDFLRTSNSWANQTKLLSLQFDSLKATLGQGLINVLTPVVQLLNTLIAKLQQFAVAFRDVTASLFGNAAQGSSGGVAATLGEAANNAEQLEGAVTAAGKAAKKATAGFDELNVLSTDSGSGGGAAASSVGISGTASAGTMTAYAPDTSGLDAFRSKLEDTLNWFKTTFQPSISSWGTAFSIIAPSAENAGLRISTAFSNLLNDSLKPFGSYLFSDFVPNTVNTFSETFAPIFSDVLPVAFDIFATDFENSCLVVDEVCKLLESAFRNVETVFSDMCLSISENWNQYGSNLTAGFQKFRESLWDIWWNIYNNIINPILQGIGTEFSSLWIDHLKPFVDRFISFFLSIGDAALSLWNTYLKPLIDYWVAVFAPKIQNGIQQVVKIFSVGIAMIADILGGLFAFLEGIINFIVGIFSLDLERAFNQGLLNIIRGFVESFVGLFKGLVNACVWVMNALISFIWSGISGIINGLGNIVSSVGDILGKDWGFSVPTKPYQIPYLAQGAVIPPNAPFMAVLGDQRHGTNIEAPLDTIKQALAEVLAMQGTGGGETVVNVNFTGDLAQLARILKPVIDTETKRKGVSLAKGGF